MKNVIKKLKEFNATIDLSKDFNYKFDIDERVFDPNEIKELKAINNLYQRNVKLKWLIHDKYKKNSATKITEYWIIKEWGRIKSFKENSRNSSKIDEFKAQLDKRELDSDTFGTISSLSKIASFMDLDEFVIYDSRVIYTLNWVILTKENNEAFNTKYFPMPNGRKKIIKDFDINPIINISHVDLYDAEKPLFISYKSAYFEFCDFIKKASLEIFGEGSKPYQLEMLLFTLADKKIPDEIKRSIKITQYIEN